jgi:hypothetical protein
MDCVHVANFGCRDDPIDLEVAIAARGVADTDRLVGELDMKAIRVCLGIHRESADAHFLTGADDAEGNLTAIGYEDFVEHGRAELADLDPE